MAITGNSKGKNKQQQKRNAGFFASLRMTGLLGRAEGEQATAWARTSRGKGKWGLLYAGLEGRDD